MRKLLTILLSINSLRKTLGNALFFRATKFNYHLEIVRDEVLFLDKKVLVLAPHPDDDVFGMGGTIKKISGQNKVSVAYFCDGAGGLAKDARIKSDKNLVSVRRGEASRAGEILGVDEQTFFGYQDGKLNAGQGVLRALGSLIKQFEPDIIFLPSFLDNHPDHRSTNEILVKCLAQMEKWPKKATWTGIKEIWAYEVWTPLTPNRIVMINGTMDAKRSAVATQASQLKTRGYDKAIFGLNEYRAEINNQSGFAEAFFASTPEIYRNLYEKIK